MICAYLNDHKNQRSNPGKSRVDYFSQATNKKQMRHYFNAMIMCLLITAVVSATINFIPAKTINNYYYSSTLQNSNMASDTFNMTTTRIFDAPLEKVWKAWSTSEWVKQWWGPKGFTCPVANMAFREGGVSFVCMRAPKEFGGQDMYNTWSYRRIVPMERIEYTVNFSDKDGNKLDPASIGLPPGIPKDVPHVVTFKDLGNNKTEVSVVEYGYTSARVVELSRSGMNECLDKMAMLWLLSH
jgi:uncharacterized protein YndB with AHSA1/START domain